MKDHKGFKVHATLIQLTTGPATNIKEELSRQPEYPSQLAISSVLANWDVPNAAFEIDSYNLPELSARCTAHLDIIKVFHRSLSMKWSSPNPRSIRFKVSELRSAYLRTLDVEIKYCWPTIKFLLRKTR